MKPFQMAHLFEPLQLRELTVKNRIVVSPMCQYSSIHGFANEWHFVHLGARAIGGAGIVFTEAAAVSPEGRISPDDLGIWDDRHVDYLEKVCSFIRSHGSVPAIQLAHAGRKASHSSPWKGNLPLYPGENGWIPLGPSPLPYKNTDLMPREMELIDIQKVIGDSAAAAARAVKAGFQVIEIHAAHGYLINEFLSPLSNLREDNYGGSFENRCRLLVEIVEATRRIIPISMPLFVRISATDWADGGWAIEDSIELSKKLKTHGVDLVDCSSGGNVHFQKITVKPLYQVPFAEQIKMNAKIATGAVGLITTAAEANAIIVNEQADLIFMARQFLRDPNFPLHAARELGIDLNWPLQYQRAK